MDRAETLIDRRTLLAVRMWLEYALEGDESSERATGKSVNACVATALGLLDDDPQAWAEHGAHKALVAMRAGSV